MPFKTRISQRFTERSVNDFLLKELLASHKIHGQLREIIWELEVQNEELRDLLKKSEEIGRVDRNYIRMLDRRSFWNKLKNLFAPDGSFLGVESKAETMNRELLREVIWMILKLAMVVILSMAAWCIAIIIFAKVMNLFA